METMTQSQVDLFADNLPSMEEIFQLSLFVNSSEANRIAFEAKLQKNMAQTGQAAVLANGIALCILGKYKQAAEQLKKARDGKEKLMHMALALRETGRFDEALECLKNSLKFEADSLSVTLEKVAVYRHARNFDAAEKELKTCVNFANISAEYHYQLGRLQESRGLYKQAMDNFKTALELSPEHHKALFHLAYRCDICGDEEAAIDYYKEIASTSPAYVSAMLNLAVLYEDEDKFGKAAQYVDKVLEYHPNHPRALLFKKDIDSSKTMYYDEEKEKKKTRKTQILETPISDFELSVRSRNCLQKMNIHTIGDLLNITEVELLSYKNFGETSLREIKAVLESKNLHLGMAVEEKQLVSMDIADSELGNEEMSADEGILGKPVDDLQLSVRAKKCLQKLNIRTIGELTHKTEAELLGCKNFGVTSLNEIKKAITSFGLSLRRLD